MVILFRYTTKKLLYWYACLRNNINKSTKKELEVNKKMVTYKGKKVYLGIDVHKKTYTFSAYCQGIICKTATTPAYSKEFAKDMKKWFYGAEIFSAYEAGFSGFGLHRELESAEINNIVINPASLETASKDKVKTDKKDSGKLAIQLATGRLKSIYIPSRQEELDRLLTRTREQVVKERSRTSNRIKGRLLYFELIDPSDDRIVSEKLLKEYESLELPDELNHSLGILFSQWRFLNKQLEDIKFEMKGQSYGDSYREAIYQSTPGIGDICARVFSNELGDLSKRFRSQKALFQFIGITPTEYSSGEKQRLGHIDRQGPARVRKLLIQCAWRAIELDEALKDSFNRIAHRRGKKRAIVAIARKLIGRVRSCFSNECEYTLGLIA